MSEELGDRSESWRIQARVVDNGSEWLANEIEKLAKRSECVLALVRGLANRSVLDQESSRIVHTRSEGMVRGCAQLQESWPRTRAKG